MSDLHPDNLDAQIVLVDDNSQNVRFLEQLLELEGFRRLTGITDSALALPTIEKLRPDLVLLDLHMPKPDGFEILRGLRLSKSDLGYLPVLVFTADTTPEARIEALRVGASDFLTKPADTTEILFRVRNFLEARRMHVQLREKSSELEIRVLERTAQLTAAQHGALEALARASEFRDDATGQHTRRVGEMSAKIAESLGHPKDMVQSIRLAAPIHDIGKISVPDAILLKPGRLDASELAIMRKHTVIGAEMLSTIDSPLMAMARDIALCHHERWDGQGYPNGRMGEDIPLPARIVAVADVYDALTHKRPYKIAWPRKSAVDEIRVQSGRQFDPRVVDAFCRI